MIIEHTIATGVKTFHWFQSAVSCVWAELVALTPLERWEAARKMRGSFLLDRWFICFEVTVVIILSVVLTVVVFNRVRKQRQRERRSFNNGANRRGLSADERNLLFVIADRAALKHKQAIFTMSGAFEQGAAVLMQQHFAAGIDIDERKELNAQITELRNKLGFQKKARSSSVRVAIAKTLSSRQIPIGKGVLITRRKGRSSERIEATIIRNDDFELALRLPIPIKSEPGGIWRVRYSLGASVWEFDAVTISFDGIELLLSHSNEIRYINRRRFLRVPVKTQAFVARFPFRRTQVGRKLTVPEFVSAELVELAGPGLRIETPLKLETEDRVLVAFKLAKERMVQDLGRVRRVIRATKQTCCAAIELIGLDEEGINELVRATNAAALKLKPGTKQEPPDTPQDEMTDLETAALVQGVQI